MTIFRDKDHTEPNKYFNAIVIEPETDLGNNLDFSAPLTDERRKQGWKAAEVAFNKYQSTPDPATARSYEPVSA